MKFKTFWIQMFTGDKNISSKRVMGVAGWLTCIFVCVWCVCMGIEAPQVIDMLFICSSSLLGIDSLAGAFNKKTIRYEGTPQKEEKDEIIYVEEVEEK